MSAGTLPAPGTEHGPCAAPFGCAHKDCAEMRAMASAICPYCGVCIGYGVPFYDLRPNKAGLVHARCAEARG